MTLFDDFIQTSKLCLVVGSSTSYLPKPTLLQNQLGICCLWDMITKDLWEGGLL